MLKTVRVGTLIIGFVLSLTSVFADDTLSLTYLISEAQKNNPEILAALKRYEAAKARIPQAKSLDDPTIGFTFEKIPRGTVKIGQTSPEDRMLTFTQFLPFFGKLSLKGKIALVESQMFAAEYKSKELEVINQVKNAYYALWLSYKEIALNNESLDLLERIAKLAETNYALGDMRQEEVYKIHAEIARLNTDLLNLQQEKLALQTKLNTLLNREPEAVLGIPVLDDEGIAFKEDVKSLYQATLLNQPELIMFSYAIEKNKHAKSLAKRSFFPDLMASIVQRGITSGTIGPWDLMLSFTVPLWFWTKQRYEVREAIANLEEAEAAYKAMQNKAFAEVKQLFSDIQIEKNNIKAFKTSLIPIVEGSIASSLASFRSGKGDFMMLLDAHRMLIETKMNYYKALVDYNRNVADLERAVGLALH
ncbi:MAG: TolC family protein [Candidatus Omnitrophica bacterium]|nr:TolC family protein [Candidatus Omnitrophota bacterium]